MNTYINKICWFCFRVDHLTLDNQLDGLLLEKTSFSFSVVINCLQFFIQSYGHCEISPIYIGLSLYIVIIQALSKQPSWWGIMNVAPLSHLKDTISWLPSPVAMPLFFLPLFYDVPWVLGIDFPLWMYVLELASHGHLFSALRLNMTLLWSPSASQKASLMRVILTCGYKDECIESSEEWRRNGLGNGGRKCSSKIHDLTGHGQLTSFHINRNNNAKNHLGLQKNPNNQRNLDQMRKAAGIIWSDFKIYWKAARIKPSWYQHKTDLCTSRTD